MSNSVTKLTDSEQLADLIEQTIVHQTQNILSAVEADREDFGGCSQTSVDVNFGDDIQLNINVGGSRFDSVQVRAAKVRGFWSDSSVSARIGLDRLRRLQNGDIEPSLRVDVSSSSGGEDLGDLTLAQAYINKGKAIQIVAEAMAILESNETIAKKIEDLSNAHLRLSEVFEERREKAQAARAQATRDKLMADKDLYLVNDIDIEAFIEQAKSLALNTEFGDKVVLAFHDGRHTDKEGDEALEAVAFYNNSTSSRRMTNQYLDRYTAISKMKHEPTSPSRSCDKLSLKDLKSFLSRDKGIFVSRSKSDPRLVEKLM